MQFGIQTKGKCERLIQTIQTGFESTLRMEGNHAKSLEHLNSKFAAWIQTIYHLRAHGSTGVSPEARYQQAAQSLRHWDPSLDIEPLFYLRLNRTVRKNGTVRLDNDLYEVPLSLRTLEVLAQNHRWALGYNIAAIPLAAVGVVPPWLAAIGMSVSSIAVVLNSQRIGRVPRARRAAALEVAPETIDVASDTVDVA